MRGYWADLILAIGPVEVGVSGYLLRCRLDWRVAPRQLRLASGVLGNTERPSNNNRKGNCRQTPPSSPARNAAVGVPTTSDSVGAAKAMEHNSFCLKARGGGRKLSANGIVDMRGNFIDEPFAMPAWAA
jgi:hypothetical protein